MHDFSCILQNFYASIGPQSFPYEITATLQGEANEDGKALMKKKSTSQSARVLVALLVCPAACLILAGTVPAFFRSSVPSQLPQRTLTFAERVSYQRAIEDVYWRHRIWPKDNPNPKPSLDAVISQVSPGLVSLGTAGITAAQVGHCVILGQAQHQVQRPQALAGRRWISQVAIDDDRIHQDRLPMSF